MAKDGDVIDTMLGRILNMLIKFAVALIGGLLSLIGKGFKALFSKRENVIIINNLN